MSDRAHAKTALEELQVIDRDALPVDMTVETGIATLTDSGASTVDSGPLPSATGGRSRRVVRRRVRGRCVC